MHDVIILDLPQGSLLSPAIQLAYVVAIIFTFPLQLYPVCQIFEKKMTNNWMVVNLERFLHDLGCCGGCYVTPWSSFIVVAFAGTTSV